MIIDKNENINIAIISPKEVAYSETFIHAHKKYLDGKVFFYHGTTMAIKLDGIPISKNNFWSQNLFVLKRKLLKYTYHKYELDYLKSFKENNIEAVLAEYGHSGVRVLKVCKKLKLPLIIHFHGHDAHNKDIVKTYGESYKEMFVYASAVISVSQYMTNQLIALGCRKEQIVYNPYGPQDDFYDVKLNYNSNQFLAVGRFVDKKAPYITLLSFKEVLTKNPEARLVMIGDGPLLNTCRNLVKVWSIDHAVTFKGSLTHTEVKEEMAKSFCFVQHSIVAQDGDAEGSPVGIIEAASAGLPIVSTKHAGICETVIHEKTGFLVDELDATGMTTFMKQLFEDKELSKKMGEAGKQHIKDHFSLQKHINKLNELIVDAIRKAAN